MLLHFKGKYTCYPKSISSTLFWQMACLELQSSNRPSAQLLLTIVIQNSFRSSWKLKFSNFFIALLDENCQIIIRKRWVKRLQSIKQGLAITKSIGLHRRSSFRFICRTSYFSEKERVSFVTTSRHAFRFSRFSFGPWSLVLSGCFSLVWSPAASHWWWWSWRGTSQQGQKGGWDEIEFPVSLDS